MNLSVTEHERLGILAMRKLVIAGSGLVLEIERLTSGYVPNKTGISLSLWENALSEVRKTKERS